MVVHWWTWAGFVGLILALLTVDLAVVGRSDKDPTVRRSAALVAVWVTLALVFAVGIWAYAGPTRAGEFLAGYVIEWSLSVDNMFIFALLFTYFALPRKYQHGVLFWGILGALAFRAAFIVAGAALLHAFAWMIYVFGAFLIITGLRMARSGADEVHPEHNPVLVLLRKILPITKDYHGHRFFVRQSGRRMATPLLAVLVAVETTDIVFAIDSIPAIFGVTREPFVVFTSNAFAILGLRSLYFLLAGMMGQFRYLKLGLSIVLVLVGAKMAAGGWVHVPIGASLGIIGLIIAASIAASVRIDIKEGNRVRRGDRATRG